MKQAVSSIQTQRLTHGMVKTCIKLHSMILPDGIEVKWKRKAVLNTKFPLDVIFCIIHWVSKEAVDSTLNCLEISLYAQCMSRIASFHSSMLIRINIHCAIIFFSLLILRALIYTNPQIGNFYLRIGRLYCWLVFWMVEK